MAHRIHHPVRASRNPIVIEVVRVGEDEQQAARDGFEQARTEYGGGLPSGNHVRLGGDFFRWLGAVLIGDTLALEERAAELQQRIEPAVGATPAEARLDARSRAAGGSLVVT